MTVSVVHSGKATLEFGGTVKLFAVATFITTMLFASPKGAPRHGVMISGALSNSLNGAPGEQVLELEVMLRDS
jgi:hypothetical protein